MAARAKGLGLFTVYPTLGIVLPGMHRSRDVADPVLDFLAPEMWWYGPDRDGGDRSVRIGRRRRAVAGAMVAPIPAWLVVRGPVPRDDRVRLPQYSLVEALVDKI